MTLRRLSLDLEPVVTRPAEPARHWLTGLLTSGAVHLAGGVVLSSLAGAALPRFIPPPHGPGSIDLRAARAIIVESVAEPEPVRQVTLVRARAAERLEAADSEPGLRKRAVSPLGELPPSDAIEETAPVDRHVAVLLDQRPVRAEESVFPDAGAEPLAPPPRSSSPRSPATSQPVTAPATASAPAPASRQNRGQQERTPPRKLYSPAPSYPPDALRAGIGGRVVLRVRVATDGSVIAASLLRSSGHESLDRAALAVIPRWQFDPARRFGLPVEMEIAVPITFVIGAGE